MAGKQPKDFIQNNLDGRTRYTFKVEEMGVYIGQEEYGASGSGSSGGGRYISYEDFILGEEHDWILKNFSQEILTSGIQAAEEWKGKK